MDYRIYRVQATARAPLLAFMKSALRDAGCSIIQCSPDHEAPFRISFETPEGERMGILAYAFLANNRRTRNRPADEHRFQIKYGSKDGEYHDLYQDPYGLYTTLFLGINPELGFFVGADPILHSPTRLFISLEFKHAQAEEIQQRGWCSWERDSSRREDEPVEILVGGTAREFLTYVRFERAALREDQGHRQLLADQIAATPTSPLFVAAPSLAAGTPTAISLPVVHALAQEFEMAESEVLDLIASARRLKMAVRGWVAEEKLVKTLQSVQGVSSCVRLDEEGGPDVRLSFQGSRPLTIQCKNALRKTTSDGLIRLDLQKTRASKGDPCSRYYRADEFDLVAACLHSVTTKWEFKYALPGGLDRHKTCSGRLSNTVKLDRRWTSEAQAALAQAVGHS